MVKRDSPVEFGQRNFHSFRNLSDDIFTQKSVPIMECMEDPEQRCGLSFPMLDNRVVMGRDLHVAKSIFCRFLPRRKGGLGGMRKSTGGRGGGGGGGGGDHGVLLMWRHSNESYGGCLASILFVGLTSLVQQDVIFAPEFLIRSSAADLDMLRA